MPRFHRHMNHAMGKEYHTKEDYLRDMKKMNLAPSNSPDAQAKKIKCKEYKPSGWARDMIRAAERRKDDHGVVHLSSSMIDQLKSSSRSKPLPKELMNKLNKKQGGFYGA